MSYNRSKFEENDYPTRTEYLSSIRKLDIKNEIPLTYSEERLNSTSISNFPHISQSSLSPYIQKYKDPSTHNMDIPSYRTIKKSDSNPDLRTSVSSQSIPKYQNRAKTDLNIQSNVSSPSTQRYQESIRSNLNIRPSISLSPSAQKHLEKNLEKHLEKKSYSSEYHPSKINYISKNPSNRKLESDINQLNPEYNTQKIPVQERKKYHQYSEIPLKDENIPRIYSERRPLKNENPPMIYSEVSSFKK